VPAEGLAARKVGTRQRLRTHSRLATSAYNAQR
jgi:hypothetical protein